MNDLLHLRQSIATSLLIMALGYASLVAAHDFYVAPDGDAGNPGTLAQPFDSLATARDAIRQMTDSNTYPEEGVTVHLRAGTYALTAPFELTARDSGRKNAPIRYRAYRQERVDLIGGIQLQLSDFMPVVEERTTARLLPAAKGRALQYKLGNEIVDCGELPLYGHSMHCLELMTAYRSGPPAPQLYWADQPLTLARWPDQDYTKVGKVVDPGDSIRYWMDDQRGRPKYVPPEARPEQPRGFAFQLVESERLARWAAAEDLRLYGYWFNNWSDQAVEVDRIDADAGILHVRQPSAYGIRTNQRFHAYNLIEEMDQPGEWYLDRRQRVLYLIPPDKQTTVTLHLSLLKDPLITLNDTSHVSFEGLNIGYTRGNAVTINGGRGVSLVNCQIANVGERAIVIEGGREHAVSDCRIFNAGGGGIVVTGGVMETLTPAGHRVENCLIHDYALTVKTYRAAVQIDGVGIRVAHNEIHSGAHLGINFGGNDHLIEFNHIYDVCRETDDMAAIYAGRSWTARGTVIRHNLIRNLSGYKPGTHLVSGVYLDDGMSGILVEGNIFLDLPQAIMFNGGRDNRAVNNLIMNAENMIRSTSLHEAYTTWAKGSWHTLRQRLQTVPIDSPPWQTAYRHLPGILDDQPELPKYTVISDNLRFNAPLTRGKTGMHDEVIQYGTVLNNPEIDRPPGHYNNQTRRFTFVPESGVFDKMPKLKSIPAAQIGRLVSADTERRPPQLPGVSRGTWGGGIDGHWSPITDHPITDHGSREVDTKLLGYIYSGNCPWQGFGAYLQAGAQKIDLRKQQIILEIK